MIVGLDFGTTNSIISYWDEKAQQPVVYSYRHQVYTPSAVAYEEDKLVDIGENAMTYWEDNHEQVVLCRFFKPLLSHESKADWKAKGWSHEQTPIAVARDYIQALLQKSADSLEQNMDGQKITKLVVSVPELWQKGLVNTGAERLQKILTQDLKLPVDRLMSEPLAAVAYYIWKAQLKPEEKQRVLVCDMGGGTFDVSFCEVSSKGVVVRAFDGNDDNRAGVFELKAILKNVYRSNNQPIEEESFAFNRDLWKLDRTIQMPTTAERLQAAYKNYDRSPERYGRQLNTGVSIGGMKVTAADAFEAFEKVRLGIIEVLDRLSKQLGGKIPFEQLLLVGGFSRYFLVRKTILDYFDLKEDAPEVKQFSLNDSLYAIAHGSALIAAGQVEVSEFFPHSIYYQGFEWNGKKIDIPITEAGKSQNKNGLMFSEYKVKILGQEFKLEGYILLNGYKAEKKSFAKEVTIPFTVESDWRYRIGVEIDRSNVAHCVVEDKDQKLYRIPIGELFRHGMYVTKQ